MRRHLATILFYRFRDWLLNRGGLTLFTATSAVILKTENEHHHLSSLSGDNILGTGVRIGRGEDAVASGSSSPVMDSAQSAMMKQADYVVGQWTKSTIFFYGKRDDGFYDRKATIRFYRRLRLINLIIITNLVIVTVLSVSVLSKRRACFVNLWYRACCCVKWNKFHFSCNFK